MKKKHLLGLVRIICLALILATLLSSSAEATIWKFVVSPSASTVTWAFWPNQRFQEMVEKATGGQLKFETKLGLYSPAENLFAVMDGRADIGVQWTDFVSGTFPLWSYGGLPFFFHNPPFEFERAVNDPRMIRIMDKSFDKAGLINLIFTSSHNLDVVYASKPISTIADFKGLKVRTSGLIPTYAMELLGAAPLTIATSEIAEAMRRGTVDAVHTSHSFGLGTGLWDVAKFASIWPVQPQYPVVVVVNKKSWNAISPQMQKIVKEVAKEFQGQMFLAIDSNNKAARLALERALKVTVPDPAEVEKAKRLTKPAIDKWVKIAGPEAAEVLAICSEYASGAK